MDEEPLDLVEVTNHSQPHSCRVWYNHSTTKFDVNVEDGLGKVLASFPNLHTRDMVECVKDNSVMPPVAQAQPLPSGHKHTHDCIQGCEHVVYHGSFDSEYAD